MNGRIKSAFQLIFFLALAVFLCWFAFRGQDLATIKNSLLEAHYGWLFPALVFALLSNISRAIRWNMLIHPMGYRPKTINTFGAVMIGYLANLAVPRIGEITRCTVLNRYEKIPVQSLLGTVLAERVIDVITLLVILAFVILAQFQLMSEFVMTNFFSPLSVKIAALFQHSTLSYIIVAVIFLAIILIGWKILSRFRSTKIYQKFLGLLKGFAEGFRTVGKLKSKWLFIAHTVFIWGCYTMMSYLCFFCFDFTSGMNLLKGLTAMVFGGIGFVVPVQGGIGAYHYIVQQTLMVYGLNAEQGLSFATICHGAQFIAIVFLGVISLIALPILNRKENKNVAS